jgi:hypothetical protein
MEPEYLASLDSTVLTSIKGIKPDTLFFAFANTGLFDTLTSITINGILQVTWKTDYSVTLKIQPGNIQVTCPEIATYKLVFLEG